MKIISLYHVRLSSCSFVEITKSGFQWLNSYSTKQLCFLQIQKCLCYGVRAWNIFEVCLSIIIIFSSCWKSWRTSDSACAWSTKVSTWTHDWYTVNFNKWTWCVQCTHMYTCQNTTQQHVKDIIFMRKQGIIRTAFMNNSYVDCHKNQSRVYINSITFSFNICSCALPNMVVSIYKRTRHTWSYESYTNRRKMRGLDEHVKTSLAYW